MNLKLVTRILDKFRHIRLVTMRTAEAGIAFAMAHRTDLILLDMNMPYLDGYAIMKQLKSLHDPQLPPNGRLCVSTPLSAPNYWPAMTRI
ncbi:MULTISPECIES: response regulator [Brenneria]|uniref:response regulator n=1 Tax=Brenneria TaxID=71655 RepID=UPI0002FD26BB|nr:MULTISPECIES: response regulator [Brenneria]